MMSTTWVVTLSNGMWIALRRLLRLILILLFSIVTLGMFFEIWLRYLLKLPLMGIEEVAALAAFWLYFIGGAYASYERSHVKAELIHLFLSRRALAVVQVMTSLLATSLGCLLSIWGFHYVIWAIAKNPASPIFRMPMVYVQSSIFVGFVLISFYSFIELIDKIRNMFHEYHRQEYSERG